MSRSSSAVVDTKVAELQLDNSNFEKNAATTIATVQDLQKALNFEVSNKSFDEISKGAKKVDFNPILSGIQSVKAEFKALDAVSFGFFSKIGQKIFDTTEKIVTAIPRQIISGGKSRSLNIEQAKFQIDGLAKSTGYLGDAWKDVSKDIDYAVSGTAYGMDVAAKAASQLMASGIEFGDTFGPTGSSPMAKALRGISGVAAMTSSSYEEIGSIFTKTAGQGAIMGGELQQLSSKGLNVAADLAKFFNGVNDGSIQASETVEKAVKKVTTSVSTSEADIREWASKRKISFDIFSEAMDRAYGEHATEANKTFAGSLTNVKAQLSKIGELFTTPVFENGQKFFSSLYDVVKDLRIIIQDSRFLAWFKETSNVIGDKFASAFGKAHNALQTFINSKQNKAVETFRKAFGGTFDKIEESTGLISKMRNYFGLGDAAKDTEENTKKINASFESVKDTVVATIRGDYKNGMERIKNLTEAGFNADTIQSYVNELWELTGHDWSKLSDDIYAQVKGNEELAESTEEVGQATEDSMGPLEHVLSGILNLWSGINNVVGIARALIEGAWDSFTGVEGPLSSIAAKFDGIAQMFNTFTLEHADEIEQVFNGVGNAIMLVWDTLSMGGKLVFGFVNGVLEGFGTTVWDLILAVSNAVTAFRNWIKENKIIERTIENVRKAAFWLTGTLKGLWDSFTNLPIVKESIDALGGAFTFLRDNFLAVTQKGGKVLKRFWSMLRVGFKFAKDPKELFGNIKGAFSYLWSEIKNSVTVAKFKEAIGSVKETIATFFSDLGKNEDGTLNTFGKLQNGFTKFTQGIGNSIEQFKKDGSFSNLFGNVKLTFQGLWGSVKSSGFFENIKNAFDTALKTVDEFFVSIGTNADGTKNWFGTAYGFITSFTGSIWENLGTLGTGFKDFFLSLPDFIGGLPGKFQEFLDKVEELGGFKFENLGDIWQAFKDTFKSYFDENDILQPIRDAFDKVKETIKQKLEEAGFNVEELQETFENFKTTLSQGWEDLTSGGIFAALKNLLTGHETGVEEVNKAVDEKGGGILGFFEKIKKTVQGSFLWKAALSIGQFFGKIWTAVTSIEPATLLKVIGAIVAFKAFKEVWGTIKEVLSSFIGLINSKANLNNAKANLFNKAVLIEIAAAIGIIAYCIYQLAKLPDLAKAEEAALLLAAVLASLVVAMAVLNSKVVRGNGDYKGIVLAMMEIAAAVGIVVLTLEKLMSIGDVGQIQEYMAVLGEALLGLSVALGALSFFTGGGAGIFTIGLGFVALATSLYEIVLSIEKLKDMTPQDAEQAGDNFARAIEGFIEKIKGVDFTGVDWTGIQSFTDALGGAAMTAFWSGVGEFVVNVLPGTGKDKSLLQRFLDAADTLGETIKLWNEKMAEVPGVNVAPLENLGDLREAVKQISMAGWGIGSRDFWANILPFNESSSSGRNPSTPQRFADAAQVLIDTITGWNDQMNNVPGVNTRPLLRIDELKEAVRKISFAGWGIAARDFWANILPGNGENVSTPQRFADAAQVLIDTITNWNTKMEEVPEVKTDGLKNFDDLRDAVKQASWSGVGLAFDTFVSNIFAETTLDESSSVGKFGEGVDKLSEAITTWNTKMGDVPEVKTDALTNFDDLKTALNSSSVSGVAVAMDSFVTNVFTDSDGSSSSSVGTFGDAVEKLSEACTGWNDHMKGVTIPEIPVDKITALGQALEDLPSTGFLEHIGHIFGASTTEEDVENFKTDITKLGEALSTFSSSFTDVKQTDVDNGVKIVEAFASLGDNLSAFVIASGANFETSNLIAFAQSLVGDTGLSGYLKRFVEELPDSSSVTAITENFASLVDSTKVLSEMDLTNGDFFDDSKVQQMQTNVSRLTGAVIATTAAGALSFGVGAFVDSVGKISAVAFTGDLLNDQIVSKFINNIDRLASKISSINVDTTKIDSLTNSITKLNSTKLEAGNMGSDMGGKISENIGGSIDSSKISSGVSTALSSAMSGIDVSGYSSIGAKIAGQIASGLSTSGRTIRTALETVVSNAKDAIDNKKSEFTAAGRALDSGLAKGINDGKSLAITAAASVAAQALNAAKAKLDIHSPSKEMEKVGMFFDVGFAKGLRNFSADVYDESSNVASLAIDGLSKAVSMASDILDGEDITRPVITPVVDLSNVESVADSLTRIFDQTPFLSTNIGAITANADAIRQMNANGDILDALAELGTILGSRGGDTYNVNGVTYDDGSNISDAVKDLIRAAKIERRA